MEKSPYLAQKKRLLRDFDRMVTRLRRVLVERVEQKAVDGMIVEARQEYAGFIPQMPYIGDKQPFTQFIVSAAWTLAMYRVLQRYKYTEDEIGVLILCVFKGMIQLYPDMVLRMFGRKLFSRRYQRNLRRRAAASHQSPYPQDYVYNYVEGDGSSFDFGVDYLDCVAFNFLAAQGAPELTCYLCAADVLYSDAFGWGLVRTKTLAEGDEKCDFRFKKGGETKVVVSTSIRKYIDA